MSGLKPFDFSLFSDKHLADLERQLQAEIKRRRELAKSFQRLSETGGPAYRNPRNSAETWSGRGRQPAWVREALARGSCLEDLAIDEG